MNEHKKIHLRRALLLAAFLLPMVWQSALAQSRALVAKGEAARLVAQFNGPAIPIGRFYGDANFSKDGSLLAVPGNDEYTQVWEVKSGRLICKFRNPTNGTHYDEVMAGAFSDDNELLARAFQRTISVLSIISGSALQEIEITPRTKTDAVKIQLLTFSADRRLLFVTLEKADPNLFELVVIDIESKQIFSRRDDGSMPSTSNVLDPPNPPDTEWGRRLRSLAAAEARFRASNITLESPDLKPESLRMIAVEPVSDLVAMAKGGNVIDDVVIIVSLGLHKEISRLVGFSSRQADASAKFSWRMMIENSVIGQTADLDRSKPDDSVPWKKFGRPIFSSNHRFAVYTSKEDESGSTFDLIAFPSGRSVGKLDWKPGSWALAVSNDGKYLVLMDSSRIWVVDQKDGSTAREFPAASIRAAENVNSASFGWDNTSVALFQAKGEYCYILIWDLRKRIERSRVPVPGDIFYQQNSYSLAISPDGKHVAAPFSPGDWQDLEKREVLVFDIKTRRPLVRLVHPVDINEIVYSTNGNYIATNAQDRIARIWDAASGKVRFEIGEPGDNLQFSSDDRYVFSDSVVYRVTDGREICRFYAFSNGLEAVVAPDGRFDINSFDNVKGLHWVVPSAPFTTLPLEIFSRNYFEPELLLRLMRCDKSQDCSLQPIPNISEINRVQPRVGKPAASARVRHEQ